jgi:hypothetical protein
VKSTNRVNRFQFLAKSRQVPAPYDCYVNVPVDVTEYSSGTASSVIIFQPLIRPIQVSQVPFSCYGFFYSKGGIAGCVTEDFIDFGSDAG